MLTFLPVEQIDEEFGKLEGKDLNRAKETLAYELTKTVHGEEEAKRPSQPQSSYLKRPVSATTCRQRKLRQGTSKMT
jgi:tyrosyl-tRNA synthetase